MGGQEKTQSLGTFSNLGGQLLLPFAASVLTGVLGLEAVRQLNEGSALKETDLHQSAPGVRSVEQSTSAWRLIDVRTLLLSPERNGSNCFL